MYLSVGCLAVPIRAKIQVKDQVAISEGGWCVIAASVCSLAERVGCRVLGLPTFLIIPAFLQIYFLCFVACCIWSSEVEHRLQIWMKVGLK